MSDAIIITPALTLGVLPFTTASLNGRTPTVREGATNREVPTIIDERRIPACHLL